ncbi:OpgC family protein [Pseudoroseicyclus aestuarii]|uniref:OpgC protein n=1 Tax=Pseudoroseicyclus aestuarii TaxID=1795041 RepID=A0A318T6R3_9RHOB|nr:OpgC domain-containing protein [Pseudoroseicyclus aestuarii]PYE86154.1 hypothetical protein DFP88_101831 [Pseudoroseicyclus aestuarii]
MPDIAVKPPASARDPRLDVFRGLALITIFIDHVPGNLYEHFTLRNIGFSDAAEAFVLMSGISSGIAYSTAMRTGGAPRWQGWGRAWTRGWTLYLVHLLITLCALGIGAICARYLGAPELIWRHGMGLLFSDPLGFLIGVPTLGHQIGYANILPLYAVLMLAVPPLLIAAIARPWALLAGSAVVWFLAAQFRVNLPLYPYDGGWFLNPFSWQLVFVIGMLTGIRMREGRALVPSNPVLRGIALGLLILIALWRLWPEFGAAGNHTLWLVSQAGVPGVFTAFNKTYLYLPRLLNVLLLLYLVSSIPAIRSACHSRVLAPIGMLGRHSLPVFALGSVLAYLVQGLKEHTGEDVAWDSLLLGTGLALQFGLAWIRDSWPKAKKPAAAQTPAQAPSQPLHLAPAAE